MVYFIIIRGPLGCGKTTIAKKLAKKLNAKYISIDLVLKKNSLDKINQKAGCILAKNFIRANEIILPEIKKQLSKGNIIIFDGCFYHKQQIKHLIKNLKHRHYIFTLKAPIEACIERDRKREKAYGEDAARAVHKLVSRRDYGVNIDLSKSIGKPVKEILSNLPRA